MEEIKFKVIITLEDLGGEEFKAIIDSVPDSKNFTPEQEAACLESPSCKIALKVMEFLTTLRNNQIDPDDE